MTEAALRKISEIENLIQQDEGNRGIKCLCIEDELVKSAELILKTEGKIGIITGFPCMLDYTPPTETDGPPGALAIARACIAAGKSVVIITDECNEEVMLGGSAGAELNMDPEKGPNLSLESFPGGSKFTLMDDMRLFELRESLSLVIAIERAGPSASGRYHTMRKKNMTDIVAPLDRLITGNFDVLRLEDNNNNRSNSSKGDIVLQPISSIGIGDGGNEVGMGKVFEKIVNSRILNGPDIACTVACDHLIVASVSNWGGYALAAAVGLLSTNSTNSFLPTREDEVRILQRMILAGARDGITGECILSVDGMPLETSLKILDQMVVN